MKAFSLTLLGLIATPVMLLIQFMVTFYVVLLMVVMWMTPVDEEKGWRELRARAHLRRRR